MSEELRQLIVSIAQAIYDKKGENILVLKVAGVSNLTDYFVIAEGQVDRHLKAIAENIDEAIASDGWSPIHKEGAGDEWMVIDYGDVIVHLFTERMRIKYQLEEVWRGAEIVDIDINVHPPGEVSA